MNREWIGRHRRESAAAASVVLVGIVILAIVLGSTTGGPGPTASPSQVGLSSIEPSAGPSLGGELGWGALQLPPYEPVAELTPRQQDRSGVATRASFELRSLTGTPAVALARNLGTYPPVKLTVRAGPTDDVAIVRPATALHARTRYTFELLAPDGSLVGEWDFRTNGPLHVVNVLPGDETTQVPVDTGIEIEFDQDGVTDLADKLAITPATEGRFERHGRTWAFVPAQNLRASTLYTVTVERGIRIEGSEQVLEEPVTFRFETAGGSASRRPTVQFNTPLLEGHPGEAPVLPVSITDPDGDRRVVRVTVEVYRLSTVREAVDAVTTLSTDLGWARTSSTGNVPLKGLPKVASVETVARGDWNGASMPLPVELEPGRYLVNVLNDGRDEQVVLQVTDASIYALASETRTVAWVNDVRTGRPIGGADVSMVGASSLGATGSNGLLDVPTPAAIVDRQESGRRTFLVAATQDDGQVIALLAADRGSWRDDPHDRWWYVFATDRTMYRTDDTIHAWGLVRRRSDRTVPQAVGVRLVAGYDTDGPPLVRATAPTTSRGTFSSAVSFADLPNGDYLVVLSIDGRDVAQTQVQIAEIRKPAFRIVVETDRRVYLHGDEVEGRAVAAFYDGTTAPGLRLRMTGSDGDRDHETIVAADRNGVAELDFRASASAGWQNHGYVWATPEQTEEGTSSGSADFTVLPSQAWLTGTAKLVGGRLEVRGHVSATDLASAEQQVATLGWVQDASGSPLPGRTVEIEVIRLTWIARQIGTTYDFILKRTVPRYEYRERSERIGSFSATSNGDGAYELILRDLPTGGSYQVKLAVRDAAGRVMRAEEWAAESGHEGAPLTQPYLETPAFGCGPFDGSVRTAQLAEQVTLTLREGDGSESPDGRTLYLAGRIGIQDARVTSDSTVTHAFEDAELPSLTVRAIRLTPGGLLVTNDVQIRLEDGQKLVEVQLEPDRSAYAPGTEATIAVRTTDPDGRPLAADVIVRVIDMKLYAVGAVEPLDTGRLMSPVTSGFLSSYASHRVPRSHGDGCGATSGGGDGPRDDFKDLASFQLVQTDASGRGRATFKLPDDITSWEVGAAAFADGLEAGTSAFELPATLPFFVDSVVASTYLAGERPILQLRAYGQGLAPGATVQFTVSSRSLGIEGTTVVGRAFETVPFELPALPLGEHRLKIIGTSDGATRMRDEVVRTLRVMPTRMRTLMSSFDPLTEGTVLSGGDGLTTYVVTDAGRGGLVEALQSLAANSSARLDAALAAEQARAMLVEEFGMDAAALPPSEFNADRLNGEGIALFPYASSDLFLTARVALAAPDEVPTGTIEYALREWANEPNATRERRIVALAGLAGIGHDVLEELRAVDAEGLTVIERLWLGLGFAAAGDAVTARSIERAILTEHGQRLGDWVRLRGGTGAESHEATALVLKLAAELRDPIALELSRYLLDNPSREHIAALEMIGFARAALRWLPREPGLFAWTIDGVRHEERLRGTEAFQLVVTAAQRESLRIELLEGAMMVATSWEGNADYDALPRHPLVQIQRAVTPAGSAAAGQLVQVRISVTIDGDAPRGCYQVTDTLPSGLAPMVTTWSPWSEEDDDIIRPYSVDGQRVSWCVDPKFLRRPLGYTARIVNPGVFRWEPAIIQSLQEPTIGSSTPLVEYTIR